MIKGLLLHLVPVVVPPVCPAAVRAKFPGFLLGNDFNGLTALLAAYCIFSSVAIQSISAAKGTNCVMRDTESLTDFYIPGTL